MPFEIKILLVGVVVGGGILMLTLGAAYNRDGEKLIAAVHACDTKGLNVYRFWTKYEQHFMCQDNEGRLYAVPMRGE